VFSSTWSFTILKQKQFTIYVWGVLAYTLAVILWGAYVRASGSGAGCGSHWPLCNGQVIPRAAQIETLVEFTHRLTTGLAGLLVLFMFIWAWRAYAQGHLVRQGAAWSLFFMVTEGLIGAALVLFELVAYNDSLARAISGALHLLNTFFLLAALTLTAWWASGGQPIRLRNQGAPSLLLGVGLLGLLLLGASGAVTALGDTIFPAGSLAEGLRQDFSPTAHFLVRLRLWHPAIAIVLGLYLVLAGSAVRVMRPMPDTIRFSRALIALFLVQLAAGTLNVLLLAPIWLQLIHLLLADLVWITLVLLCAAVLAQETADREIVHFTPQQATIGR
jgi:heme A synthase